MALARARRLGVVAGVSIKGAHCPTGGWAGATETGEKVVQASAIQKNCPGGQFPGAPGATSRSGRKRTRRREPGVRPHARLASVEGAEPERRTERPMPLRSPIPKMSVQCSAGEGTPKAHPRSERGERAGARPALVPLVLTPAPRARPTCPTAAASTRGSRCGLRIRRPRIPCRVPCATRARAACAPGRDDPACA